jgi:hypothetical protein
VAWWNLAKIRQGEEAKQRWDEDAERVRRRDEVDGKLTLVRAWPAEANTLSVLSKTATIGTAVEHLGELVFSICLRRQ